jgi:hypothetical protein
MRLFQSLLLGSAALAVFAPMGNAHFRLIEPGQWIEQNEKGDPQKAAPCGGTSADPGKPTNMVVKVQGGDKLHIKVQETVFHPGFYRISLAVNSRDELPKDPEPQTIASARGPLSVSAAIQYPPQPPILVNGLWPHTSRFDKDLETDVEIPNISCAKCTLQVIQFMANHALNKDGDYTYHHCVDLQIQPNATKPMDTRFPAEKR